MKRVCVFAGSRGGRNGAYVETARELGALLARRGIGLVYGAGKFGLMGALADAALAAGGEVIGIIPESLLEMEPPREDLSELRIVHTMHQRKAAMASLAEGFVAVPGGLGTLEETMEIITWAQLGFHAKPIGLLNVADYFAGLIAFLRHASTEGFITRENLGLFAHDPDPAALLAKMDAYVPPGKPGRWRELEKT